MKVLMRFMLLLATVFVLAGVGCASDSSGPSGEHTVAPTPDEHVGQVSQALTNPFTWSGYTWNIKDSAGALWGPGPNRWRASSDAVWIDGTGSLNLKMQKIAGLWYCAEVWMPQALGYGTYEFFVKSQGDDIDRWNVNGLFLYQDDTHEYDMEWARWGVSGSGANNGDFGSQPNAFSYWKQSIASTDWHKVRIIWSPGQVDFNLETNSVIVKSWSTTANTFAPGLALVHINNWLFQGHPPSNGASATLTLVSFTYTPSP